MNWRDFFATGYAPDFDALEYVYRAVTPPYRPRRFNARFFMADSARLANEVIESSGELLDIHWVTIEKALTLPIPRITGVVLKTIEDILENPPAKDAPGQSSRLSTARRRTQRNERTCQTAGAPARCGIACHHSGRRR